MELQAAPGPAKRMGLWNQRPGLWASKMKNPEKSGHFRQTLFLLEGVDGPLETPLFCGDGRAEQMLKDPKIQGTPFSEVMREGLRGRLFVFLPNCTID